MSGNKKLQCNQQVQLANLMAALKQGRYRIQTSRIDEDTHRISAKHFDPTRNIVITVDERSSEIRVTTSPGAGVDCRQTIATVVELLAEQGIYVRKIKGLPNKISSRARSEGQERDDVSSSPREISPGDI